MAQITPLTGEVNFVIDYFWNGCRAPFTLYATTALPLAGEVAVVLLGFDWKDITTAFFRPKGLRSARHGRKSAKRRKSGGVPQIPDLIAEHTPTIDEFASYVVSDDTKIWWKVEGAIERTTWTVALIELTSEFAYKSLLGILELKATKCDVAGRCFASGQMWEMFNNGQTYLVDLQNVAYEEYPVDFFHSVITFGDTKSYQIMVEVTAVNLGDSQGEIDVQVWIDADVGGGIFATGYRQIGAGGSVTHIGAWIVRGEGSVRIEQRSHGNIAIASASINVVPSWYPAS